MLFNYGVGKDSLRVPSKAIQPVHPKGNQSWIFIGRTDAEAETPNTLATWCKELTHWKRPWCGGQRLKVGGEGNDKGWDGWMASSTQWTWVWISSRSSWWTGKPGVLQSMGLQRVRHDWASLWTVAFQVPLSMGLSRQKYWSGLPCPPQGILSIQGTNPYLLCLLHWQACLPPGKPI